MTLIREIELIDDPQYFTKLCKALLSAQYGNDYQPIDDNSSDSGNDGYIISEQRMFARHCFKKVPNQRTNFDVITKITNDLGKAVKLRDSGKYSIKSWTFLTNYDLADAQVQKLRQLGNGQKINVNHQGPSYLATLIGGHDELLEQFPELNQTKISADLTEIKNGVNKIRSTLNNLSGVSEQEQKADKKNDPMQPTSKSKPKAVVESVNNIKDTDYNEAAKLSLSESSAAVKRRLKMIAYSSKSKVAQVQAAIGLSRQFDIESDNVQDFIEICNVGLVAAYASNNLSGAAILLADKARYLTHRLVINELDYWYGDQLNNTLLGIAVPQNDLDGLKKSALATDKERREVAVKAIDTAKEANDLRAYSHVLLYLGESAGSLASILPRIGDPSTGRAQLGLCKNLLMQAKACFESMGDEEGAIYAVHNLANQLRTFEPDLAVDLANKVIAESKKLKIPELEEKAKMIIETINRDNKKQ